MSSAPPFDAVLAVRYGTFASTKAALFYRWSEYGEPDSGVRMDYYFWLLRRGREVVMVDTGFDPQVARRRGRTVLCTASDALARAGVAPGSIDDLIITHLHYDHIGNVPLFPRARLHVDARELEFWSGPYGCRPGFAGSIEPAELRRIAAAQAQGRVRAVDGGEQTVLPGVTSVRVGGHSPGQQILRVQTVDGEIVLASDAAHFYEELALDRPFDVLHDLEQAYAALDLLRDLERSGRPVVVGHDPAVMERFPAAEGELNGLAVCLAGTW